jgi:Ca2+-binding RTX toxin-like protein
VNALAGADTVHALSGNDRVVGMAGNDVVHGGSGNDEIFSRDGTRDYVDCGPGSDVAKVDHKDVVAHNCEHVIRQG